MNGIACAFQGRVGMEPEQKFTSTGKTLLSFSVGVLENKPNGDGAETTWVKVTAWEALAEQLAESLHKGSEVYCEGRLKLSEWTAHDGQHRAGLNCSAWKVEALGAIGRKAPRRPERVAAA